MTRRTLGKLAGAVLAFGAKPLTTVAKAESEYYDITFGIGIGDPIEKGESVTPDYIVGRAGVVVSEKVDPTVGKDTGELVLLFRLNGKWATMINQTLEVGDRLNIDVSKVEGIWKNVRVVLKVRCS